MNHLKQINPVLLIIDIFVESILSLLSFWSLLIANDSIGIFIGDICGKLCQEIPDDEEGCHDIAQVHIAEITGKKRLEVSKEEDNEDTSKEEFVILGIIEDDKGKVSLREELREHDNGKGNNKNR